MPVVYFNSVLKLLQGSCHSCKPWRMGRRGSSYAAMTVTVLWESKVFPPNQGGRTHHRGCMRSPQPPQSPSLLEIALLGNRSALYFLVKNRNFPSPQRGLPSHREALEHHLMVLNKNSKWCLMALSGLYKVFKHHFHFQWKLEVTFEGFGEDFEIILRAVEAAHGTPPGLPFRMPSGCDQNSAPVTCKKLHVPIPKDFIICRFQFDPLQIPGHNLHRIV